MAEGYLKFYDSGRAAGYRDSKRRSRATHAAECRLLERAARGIPRSESIVDAPCGAGRMTLELVRLGFSPHAADVSPAMVELARDCFRERGLDIEPEVADLEASGWPDRAFDNLLSFRFFHHLPTPELRRRVAAEICRVAGKRALVTYLDGRAWTARKRALEIRMGLRKSHKHTLRPAEMHALFEEQGFRVKSDLARLPLLHSLRIIVAERR